MFRKEIISAVALSLPLLCHTARITDNTAETALETTQSSIDWTDLVAPAQDQGDCNSCYIWAAVGSLEARWALKNGQSKVGKTLSVQQALDCIRIEHMSTLEGVKTFPYKFGAKGCAKGEVGPVLQYAIDEGFVNTEDYGLLYDGESAKVREAKFRDDDDVASQCLINEELKQKIAVHPSASEARVKKLAKANFEANAIKALETGPVAIGISDSSHSMLSHRDNVNVVKEGGVAVRDCHAQGVSHAVLLVGYGELDGVAYWKIRNSFGDKRYDHGFFKIPRGSNFCSAEELGAYMEFST